jgi:hypothetical protein
MIITGAADSFKKKMRKTEETETRIFTDLKRPTVTFSKDEHKKIKQYYLGQNPPIGKIFYK